ncbi:MAG: hypothetical protein IT318_23900 [Anaerolineales bacterium]|nr:hypothetical protein [Anaerolineales bacterium]
MAGRKPARKATRKAAKVKPGAKPQPVKLPKEAFDRVARVTLTATAESLWLTRYDARGKPVVTYPVSARDVANCFGGLSGVSTGLLPPDVLFWQAAGKRDEPERVGLWLPAGVRTIYWRAGRHERPLEIPLPNLVLAGRGGSYYVFACLERTERAPLYHAPLPNISDNGAICAGNEPFPKASPATIHQAAAIFWESRFNDHQSERRIAAPGPLFDFLASLRGQTEFPADQLKRAGLTLGDFARGQGQGQAYLDWDDDDDDVEPDPEWNDWDDEDDDPAVWGGVEDEVELAA